MVESGSILFISMSNSKVLNGEKRQSDKIPHGWYSDYRDRSFVRYTYIHSHIEVKNDSGVSVVRKSVLDWGRELVKNIDGPYIVMSRKQDQEDEPETVYKLEKTRSRKEKSLNKNSKRRNGWCLWLKI